MSFGLGFWAAAGAGGAAAGAYEQIATIVTTTAGTQSFTSIPQTYKHLQIRGTGQVDTGNAFGSVFNMRINGSSGTYSTHFLNGNGSSVTSSYYSASYAFEYGMRLPGSGEQPGAFIIDILDYTNTSKHKTIRAFNGMSATNTKNIFLSSSALYANTAAVTSIDLANYLASAQPYGRFSLYGIKG